MTATVEQTNTREIETAKNGDGFEAVTVFEYGGPHGLLDLIQRSVARSINLSGANEAKTFDEVLAEYPDQAERQRKIEQVGAEFDEALVNFVVSSMIATKRRHAIIRASVKEGLDGYLPWKALLDEQVQILGGSVLKGLHIEVERYEPDIDSDARSLPTQRSGIQSTDAQSEIPLELIA